MIPSQCSYLSLTVREFYMRNKLTTGTALCTLFSGRKGLRCATANGITAFRYPKQRQAAQLPAPPCTDGTNITLKPAAWNSNIDYRVRHHVSTKAEGCPPCGCCLHLQQLQFLFTPAGSTLYIFEALNYPSLCRAPSPLLSSCIKPLCWLCTYCCSL